MSNILNSIINKKCQLTLTNELSDLNKYECNIVAIDSEFIKVIYKTKNKISKLKIIPKNTILEIEILP